MTFGTPVILTLAGAGALLGGTLVPDPKVRIVIQGGGLIAVAAGLYIGLDDVMEFLGLKEKNPVTNVTAAPIDNIQKGAPGATGVISAKITSPIENAHVEREGTFSETYPVTIEITSSRDADTQVHVTLEAQEFYSFGSDAKYTVDLGMQNARGGQAVTIDAHMHRADPNTLENPFNPPEVSLAVLLNGAITDNVRFTRY